MAPEDSDAYEHASLAATAFLKRTLDAADRVEKELLKHKALSKEDPKRLTEAEEQLYEEYLTQADALAIILPRLFQQARLVQYHPKIQEQLQDVFEIIHDRERLIEEIERARATVLLGSEHRGRPLRPEEIQELTPIATTAWILREKLSIRPELSVPQKEALQKLVASLPAAEESYKNKTNAIGDEFKDTQKVADKERKTAGAERMTQGLPKAELVLDAPEISIDVWRKLLTQGGALEKKRAAKQLGEGIQEFEQDFLKLKAYEEFKEEAHAALKEHIQKNKDIRYWIDLLDRRGAIPIPGADVAKERALTSPKEFQNIFDEVTSKVRGSFESIATSNDAKLTGELLQLLKRMEGGEIVDPQALNTCLDAYLRIQRHAGTLLASIQRWQVVENAGRVGAMRGPNMLDQVTRVGGKTLLYHLRQAAPYGIFRTRSYQDEDGRFILLESATPENLGWQYQLKEGGKAYLTLQAAILTPILHRMAMRIPLLGPRVFGRWYVRLGIPSVLGALSQVGAKEGAAEVRVRQALDAVENSFIRLEQSPGTLPPTTVRNEANSVFEHLLIILQASEGTSPNAPKQDLALEAHLYTNQLLMALDYPPYHEIGAEVIPSAKAGMSPEVREYLAVHVKERQGVNSDTHTKLETLQTTIRGSSDEPSVDLFLYTGKFPENVRKESILKALKDARRSTEFEKVALEEGRTALGTNDAARKEKAFQYAGETYLTLKKLRYIEYETRRKLGAKYFGRQSVNPEETMKLGTHSFTLPSTENEIRRLVDLSPRSVVTIARVLEDSAALSNADIAKHWYKEAYPTGRVARFLGGKKQVDQEIDKRFGAEGNRTGMGEKFLEEWVSLLEYSKEKMRK